MNHLVLQIIQIVEKTNVILSFSKSKPNLLKGHFYLYLKRNFVFFPYTQQNPEKKFNSINKSCKIANIYT